MLLHEVNDYSQIKTSKDFLNLLNETGKREFHDRFHPLSFSKILYYCSPIREELGHYRTFTIPKKSGGMRTISAPVRDLKNTQTILNRIFLTVYKPSKYAMGFTQKRSVVTNAKQHVGQRYIYNIDIKDFFSSIDKSQVSKRLMFKPFYFPYNIAHIIAGLCTMRDIDNNGNVRYILPQGAPTSPIITNMICDTLDLQLSRLAKKFGLRYSRYADDITFSSMHFVYGKKSRFINELKRIIISNGFELNEAKTRLQYPGTHQEVTGLVVSDRINVTKQYARELKLLIHIWKRYGYIHAVNSYMTNHKCKKGSIINLESIIEGKLNYMQMVKGANDTTFLKLQTSYNDVRCKHAVKLKHRFDSPRPTITINKSYTRLEIEEKLCVHFGMRLDNNKIHSYVKVNKNEIPITISRNIPKFILIKLMNSDMNDTIWDKYRISFCKNGVGSFILLHNYGGYSNSINDL